MKLQGEITQDERDPRWVVGAEWVEEGTITDIRHMTGQVTLAAQIPDWTSVVSLDGAVTALRNGYIASFAGILAENDWFDAKELVDFSSQSGKIEFVKDVVQFANSNKGGLLLIGAKTELKPGGVEVFKKIAPLDKNPRVTSTVAKLAQQARSLIDSHSYPAVEGLEISTARSAGGEVLYVHVPPQRGRLKPFLVSGEVLGEKFYGEFFTIPRRRGDGNLPISPRELHSLIAGKLLPWNDHQDDSSSGE